MPEACNFVSKDFKLLVVMLRLEKTSLVPLGALYVVDLPIHQN
jgi:hypothetical protein